MSFIINPFVFAAAGGGSFPSIASIWEWWEPEREGYTNTAPVGLLTGQVSPGTGHNWNQATSSFKGQFLTNQINGLGIVRFDGTDDSLTDVNPSALTAVHFFTVVKVGAPENSVGNPWKLGTSGLNEHYAYSGDGHIYSDAFSTTRKDVGDPTPSLLSFRVVEVISTSSEWTYKLDGAQLFTTGTNTVAAPTNCFLGYGLSAGRLLDLAGMYICSAKLGSTDRGNLVSYLNSRFALSIS